MFGNIKNWYPRLWNEVKKRQKKVVITAEQFAEITGKDY